MKRFAAIAFALACVVGVLAGWAATRGPGSGCFPGAVSLPNLTRPDPGSKGSILSVLGSSARPGVVYAVADVEGLYVGGGTPFRWRRTTMRAPYALDVASGKRHEVLYGHSGALYRSTTQGRTWTRLTCNLLIGGFGGVGVTVSKSDPASLYAIGQPGDDNFCRLGGFYRSRDDGRTWSRSTVGATAYCGPELNAVTVDPRNSDDVTLAAYAGGVFRTGNGNDWAFTRLPGPSWSQDGPQVETLAYGGGTNPVLWAGTSSGAFRRTPNGSWVRAGLAGHGVTVFPDARFARTAYAVLGFNGTGRACLDRTTNGGATWLMASLPCSVSGVSIQRQDDIVYAWTSHRIYRSADQGKHWTELPPIPVP